MSRQRLDLSMQFDYRRPVEVRAIVAELHEKAPPTEWAMVESFALEVLRQSVVDSESLAAVLSMGRENPVQQ